MRSAAPVRLLALALLPGRGQLRPHRAPNGPTPRRSPRNASYVLRATLDLANRLIVGHGRLTGAIRRRSPVTELRCPPLLERRRDPARRAWANRPAGSAATRRPNAGSRDRGFIDLGQPAVRRVSAMRTSLARVPGHRPGRRQCGRPDGVAVPLDLPVRPVSRSTSSSHGTLAGAGTLRGMGADRPIIPRRSMVPHRSRSLEDTGAARNRIRSHVSRSSSPIRGLRRGASPCPSGWMHRVHGPRSHPAGHGNGRPSHRYRAATA